MGNYVQMLDTMKNNKGHDTYDVYFTSSGRIEKIIGHYNNSGFTGTKYF